MIEKDKYLADMIKCVAHELEMVRYEAWTLKCDIVLRNGWYVILPSMFLESL